jgi:hypothetical protein
MKSHVSLEGVKNRFHFGFLGYDSELEKEANLRLVQLLAFAPPGAAGVGFVERSEKEFLSTITIRSPFRTFTSKAIGNNPRSAVRKSLERIEEDLYRWRFGSGSGNGGKQTTLPSGTQQPLQGSY